MEKRRCIDRTASDARPGTSTSVSDEDEVVGTGLQMQSLPESRNPVAKEAYVETPEPKDETAYKVATPAHRRKSELDHICLKKEIIDDFEW